MNRKKVLIILLILIILAITIFLGLNFRKMLILRDISEKQIKMQEMLDNYYQKFTRDTDKFTFVADCYTKEEKSIMFSTIIMKETGETAKSVIYSDKTGSKIYNEKEKDELIQKYGFAVIAAPSSFNYVDSNFIELFKVAQGYSIKKAVFNGKKCYVIRNNMILVDGGNPETYIEKETGLTLMSLGNIYEYEFGNVGDEIFEEPDLSIYDLHEDLISDNVNYIEIEVEDKNSLEGIKYTEPIKMENIIELQS